VRVSATLGMKEEVRDDPIEVGGGLSVGLTRGVAMVAATNPAVVAVLRRPAAATVTL
jgi:hypothetical protein